MTPEGLIQTLAGQSTLGLVDGIGTNAQFVYPVGMDMDSKGYLYVADGGQYGGPGAQSGNNGIRYITPAGTVSYTMPLRFCNLCCNG